MRPCLGCAFKIAAVCLSVMAASGDADAGLRIGGHIDGGLSLAGTPNPYGGSMVLPVWGPAAVVGVALRRGTTIAWTIDAIHVQLGKGALSGDWRSAENSYETDPSAITTGVGGAQADWGAKAVRFHAGMGIGVGRLRVGDKIITSLSTTRLAGHVGSSVAFDFRAGLSTPTRPVAFTVGLRWVTLPLQQGAVNVVPLTVGLAF